MSPAIKSSVKRLIFSYGRLMAYEAGLPILQAKIEETKEEVSSKIMKMTIKISLLFVATFLVFLFLIFGLLSIFFYFAGMTDLSIASILTGLIGLVPAILIYIVGLLMK